MLRMFFESKIKAARDVQEVLVLKSRYGSDLLPELRARAHDRGLASRDRKHWRRILRKARRTA